MGKHGNGRHRGHQIQRWILPFNRQNSQAARGHVAIDSRVFGTTTIVHLCGGVTTRPLVRPTQTRRDHADERQRDNHAQRDARKYVAKPSQSESPILWGYISFISGHLIFLSRNRS